MLIRPAVCGDLPAIAELYAAARAYMIAHNNPDQWGTQYPIAEDAEADLAREVLYAVEESGHVCGTFALIFGEEPTYGTIYDGTWQNSAPYATIHRLASDGSVPGVADACLRFAQSHSCDLRVDTHESNVLMKEKLRKHGFRRCGQITVEDGTPRTAYQWVCPNPKPAVAARSVVLGIGRPKICIPVVGNTQPEILAQTERAVELGAEVVEFRCDWFKDYEDHHALSVLLAHLREILGDIPLLFTFRTAAEGGETAISPEGYQSLLAAAISTGAVDFVDIELFLGDDLFRTLTDLAHRAGVRVIASNHDFHATPAKEELLRRLCRMQDLGADVAKIAVMPTGSADVLTLLDATRTMRDEYARVPLITMSMGGTGVISRLCGEEFGSCLTFGSAGTASAPGQVPAEELRSVLELLHRCR